MFPIDIKKTAESQLSIGWDDGHESFFTMIVLRKACPCATCKNSRSGKSQGSLKVLSPAEIIPDNLQVKEAEILGRYAVQFTWSDGHHEGIYAFDMLRELCECEICTNLETK